MTLDSSGDPNSRYQVELKPPSQENGLNFDMKLQLFHALAPLFNTLLKMKKTIFIELYRFWVRMHQTPVDRHNSMMEIVSDLSR